MAGQAQFGLLVPALLAEPLSPPDHLEKLRRFIGEAEELGFHSLWLTDRVLDRGGVRRLGVLEPLTLLAWAAALTSHIRLGTSVLLFAFRNPILVAKAAATLDHLSRGRLTLGVSLGGTEGEYRSLGVPMKERVARLRENLALLRRLWSEEEVTFQGRFYQIEGASVNPKPMQRPSIPVWLGGSHEAALSRTAELADGWVAGGRVTAAEFAAGIAQVQRLAGERGRDPAALGFGKLIYIVIDAERSRAQGMARAAFDPYYGAGFGDRYVLTGPLEDCAAELRRFAQVDAADVTLILGTPTFDVEHLHRLAQAAELVRGG